MQTAVLLATKENSAVVRCRKRTTPNRAWSLCLDEAAAIEAVGHLLLRLESSAFLDLADMHCNLYMQSRAALLCPVNEPSSPPGPLLGTQSGPA